MLRLRQTIAIAVTGTIAIAAATPLVFQEPQMPEPTEEHALMQKRVGTWEGTVTMFMPGVPATPVPATETVRSAGPFWVVSDFESDFGGMPYMGHGCHGFDATKGKYTGTWIDNMGSYLSVMEGEHDEATNTIVTTWDAPDMMGNMAPHKSVQKCDDDNAYTITFYTNEVKSMVIDMKRKSAKLREAGSDKR